VIYHILQDIVATGFTSGETSDCDFIISSCLVCFERIFKIAQYLAKLQEKS